MNNQAKPPRSVCQSVSVIQHEKGETYETGKQYVKQERLPPKWEYKILEVKRLK